MKKKLLVLSLLLGLMLVIPGFLKTGVEAALNADKWEKESNETFDSATKISVNSVIGGNLEKSSDVDCYSFSLSKAGYIKISFNHEYIDSGSNFWRIYLKTADNKEIINNYFKGNAKTDEETVILGLDKGTYYIQIQSSAYSDKEYTFKVNYTQANDWETEFNEQVEDADSIKVNSFVNGTLRTSSDVDWYSFSVANDGVLWLTFANEKVDSGSNFWKTTLYSADNKEIYNFYWKGNGVGERDSEKMGLPAGNYYLKVNASAFSSNPYRLKVNYEKNGAWETELNNTVAVADSLKVNTHVSGLLMNSSDVDFYTFSLSKKGFVRIAFSHDYIDSGSNFYIAQIYNGNTSVSKTYFKGNAIDVVYTEPIELDAGKYYVKVEDSAYSNVIYTLAVEYSSKGSFDDVVYNDATGKDDKDDKNENDNKSDNVDTSKGTFTVGDLVYKLTDDDEVQVTGVASSSVKSIVIPESITVNGEEYDVISIAKKAFKGNKKITSVVIEADLELIGANAFYGCKKLSNVTIKGDVFSIASKAFYNCKALTVIDIESSDLESVGKKAFYRINKAAEISVPSDVLSDYQKMFKNSKLTNGVTVSAN